MAQRYALNSPTIARIPYEGSYSTIAIPRDSTVEVYSDLGDRRGLVTVSFQGHLVQMFAEDIRERGTLVPPDGRNT